MLERLFMQLLNMSITAGITVLAVLLVRLMLRRAPKIFSYGLWSVVLFRLLCPVSFSAGFSFFGLGSFLDFSGEQGRMEYISEDFAAVPQPGGKGVVPFLGHAAGNMPDNMANRGEILHETGFISWILEHLVFLGSIIWIFGFLIMAGYSLFRLFRLKKSLGRADWERDNIYRCQGLKTPFVFGILRPRIYLPEALREEERPYILLHEQTHIKRKDPIIKAISFLALCIHWFNPLIWTAFFLSEEDMEMSCDEAVLKEMGDAVKKEYSLSLLSFLAGSRFVNGTPVLFGESKAKGRIKNILRYKKPRLTAAAAAVLVCFLAGFGLLANPEKKTSFAAGVPVVETGRTGRVLKAGGGKDDKSISGREYKIIVRSIARSSKCIDRYFPADTKDRPLMEFLGIEAGTEEFPDKELVFAEDCIFKANYAMDKILYEEVSFDTFAQLIEACDPYDNKPCLVTFQDGLVAEIKLESAYNKYGIHFLPKTEGNGGYEEIEKEYFLLYQEAWDAADQAGKEIIEVYLKNTKDGGLVIIRDAQGEAFYMEGADTARAGWNNIYLGEADGIGYVMTIQIEDRDEYGAYSYQVFRFGEQSEMRQIAGSCFEFGPPYVYDDELFKKWMEGMEYYLKNSRLILSSQDGKIRTKEGAKQNKYNYNSLKREF